MNAVSTQQAWREFVAANLGPEGYPGTVERIDGEGLFRFWSRMDVPVSSHYLDCAVELLCGAPDESDLAAKFLGYVRAQIERAEAEPERWQRGGAGGWGTSTLKAARWYDFVRVELYSRSLLGEAFAVEPLHFDALQGSAAEYALLPDRDWQDGYQARFIECAVVALAWGRPDLAHSILQVRRPFSHTARYHAWARGLADALLAVPAGQSVASDSTLWLQFHSLFDEVRHPTSLLRTGAASHEAAQRGDAIVSSSWSLLRLALATIKQRYLLDRPVDPGMKALIGLISE